MKRLVFGLVAMLPATAFAAEYATPAACQAYKAGINFIHFGEELIKQHPGKRFILVQVEPGEGYVTYPSIACDFSGRAQSRVVLTCANEPWKKIVYNDVVVTMNENSAAGTLTYTEVGQKPVVLQRCD